jgi:hypothetical protein
MITLSSPYRLFPNGIRILATQELDKHIIALRSKAKMWHNSYRTD